MDGSDVSCARRSRTAPACEDCYRPRGFSNQSSLSRGRPPGVGKWVKCQRSRTLCRTRPRKLVLLPSSRNFSSTDFGWF